MNRKTRRALVLSALLTTSLGLLSCGSPGAPSGSPTGTVKQYTSDVCIVTDNKLGSMGDPISYVHEGQEVKFCCAPCVKKFKANPGKYLANMR